MEGSNSKQSTPDSLNRRGGFFILAAALLVLLCALLYPSFSPETVQFSNDGPYGVISSDTWKLPQTFLGQWNDLNWLGNEDVAAPPNVTNFIRFVLGTLGFAKFDAFLTTLFAGLCGGLFSRVIGGNWWVCAMGGIAAAFNSNNFSNACWGLGSRPLCFGGIMLALSMVATGLNGRLGWVKTGLVGIGAGLAIMEGYDLGAILCAYVGLYALFVLVFPRKDEAQETGAEPVGKRLGIAAVKLVIIVAVTALTASHSLSSLADTQVKGVGIFEEKQEESQRWDFSTQWSLPKKETLRIIIPGLLGYRMDSPSGQGYWGSVGETPNYKAGGSGMPRFSGSGEYAGLLVVLIASWAVANIWRRREKSPYSTYEIRQIKFWTIVGVGSLLLAFGRYAPFYQLVYITPVFGMFRNPIKYLVPFHISMLILFGYALVGLCRGYLSSTKESSGSWGNALALGWRKLSHFDRCWNWGVLVWIGFSVIGFLIFLSSKDSLIAYMQETGINAKIAAVTFDASMWEIMDYLLLLMVGMTFMAFILGGQLGGKRVTIICGILLLVMMGDFYRANKPWVVFYNYQERLQRDDLLNLLTSVGMTDRVTVFPTGDKTGILRQIYTMEWMQHEFPHYNIHTLEHWMEPRMGSDKIAYQSAFMTNMLRYWELTGTRYLLGVAGVAPAINEALDPVKNRFMDRNLFTLEAANGARIGLARTNNEGPFSVIEFAGAIPRLALYSYWEPVATDKATLAMLNSGEFNPETTLLVDAASGASGKNLCGNQPEVFTRLNYETYSPLRFSVDVKGVAKDSILLVNDRYNPKWKAYVDGEPAEVLRCNYIARGIRLTPGDHRVEMRFEQSSVFFFVGLLMMVVGLPWVFNLLRKQKGM